MPPAERSDTAITRDGVTLHYKLLGSGQAQRPRLVLLHSLAMGSAVWDAVVEQLADTAEILTYDSRGHGRSSAPPGPYRLRRFAEDLAELLDHVHWDDAHVAGASMGGSVALQFAQLYPQRVRTLGLIDTTAWYGAGAAQKWEERARAAESGGLAPLLDFQESRWFTETFRAANGPLVVRCRTLFVANTVPAFAATCRMLGAFDLREGLADIQVPTAIVVGENDYATPVSMARELHQGIAGATLEIVPDMRHLTFVECPGAIVRALTELLSRVPAAV